MILSSNRSVAAILNKAILHGSMVFFIASLILITKQQGLAQNDKKPNIIIILTDDQGYNDVGFNGCQDIPTPNIDRLAAGGVVMTSGYVSFAVCGPSRAGLLTGRYQDRFGFSRNPVHAPNDPMMGLPLKEQTMADLLKQAGYVTGAIGKWHMGAHKSLHPNKRGFDEFFGFLGGGHRYLPSELEANTSKERLSPNDEYRSKLLHDTQPVEETEYLTDAFSREAVSFITKNKDKTFFLYLAFNAPHTPLQATEKYLSRFPNIQDQKRKTYAAMVSAVDDGVGRILHSLDELHLAENTIVFFLSDNGGPTNDNASSNQPLRGKKGDFYDGGVRVPFAVQWKGKIPRGKKYDRPVISLDIFATAAALAGATPRNPIDGKNLMPFLTGSSKDAPHDFLFWRNFDQQKFAVRSEDKKMITYKDRKELFNITNDIAEKNNVIGSLPEEEKMLDQRIENWKSTLVDPLFLGLLEEAEYTKQHPDRWKLVTD